MSLTYCYYCLDRTDNCECEECDGDCLPDVVYGDSSVAYLRGYRDALAGRDEEI